MKKLSKLLALLLTILLAVGVFAGCADNNTTTSSTPPPSSAAPVDTPSDEPEGPAYPMLCEEPATLSIWSSFTADYITSMNESKFTKELARRTNVTLEFQEASSADAATVFSLMLNSQDLTDIVRVAGTYPGGPDKAIEDDVYLRLNELIDEYAPNYKARRTFTDDIARQTITDAGNIWSIYTLAIPAEYPWCGYALRKDVLDNRGIALPVTLADWEVALQAFVDDGIDYPLLFDTSGVNINSEFLSAWNIGKEFYSRDGKVEYGYIQPEFKDYLTMMSDWYSRGYLDHEFTSHGISSLMIYPTLTPVAYALILNGEAGAGLVTWMPTDNALVANGSTQIEGFNFAAVSAPKMNAGDTINFRYNSYETRYPHAITSDCKDPVLALRLMDYLFTDEGMLLVNYGIEGVSYTMVDGKPRYTDLVLNNPDGVSPRSAATKWSWDDGMGMSDFKRLWQAYEGTSAEGALNAYNIWYQDSNAYILPQTTMTLDETNEYTPVYSDIRTYATETIPKFITGEIPLSGFDAFVSQIKSMKIDRCVEIQQAALSRYLAR